MTMEGGGREVGGVSFRGGVDLATLRRNLQEAERLARDNAARIQQALGTFQIPPQQPGAAAPRAAAPQQAAPNRAGLDRIQQARVGVMVGQGFQRDIATAVARGDISQAEAVYSTF